VTGVSALEHALNRLRGSITVLLASSGLVLLGALVVTEAASGSGPLPVLEHGAGGDLNHAERGQQHQTSKPPPPPPPVAPCGPTPGYACLNRYGYPAAHTGTWAEKYYRRPESGFHNCTRFAAYYLARLVGVGDPGHSFGDAWNWGLTDAEGGQRHRISPKELGYPVDQTPRIGAVAWWERTNRSAGHVGIVVDVGPGYVVVASDSYTHGSTEIARLSPGRLYPTAFIHIGPRRPGGVALS
jgi:hypothetical protein